MELAEYLKNAFEVKVIKPDCYQIKTGVVLPNGKPLYCFIDKLPNGFVLSDKKYVLKYMNDLYLLTSTDIKNCIKGVCNANRMKIVQGVLLTEFKDLSQVVEKIFNFIYCTGQLVNMYVFFETPS